MMEIKRFTRILLVLTVFLLVSGFVYARDPSECSDNGGACKISCGDYEIRASYSCESLIKERSSAIEPPTGHATRTGEKCCISLHNANKKDAEMFQEKEVFIISDENWQDVLSLVPLAIWTDSYGEIQKYPVLIYHKEGNTADLDSTIHFLQLYAPTKVTIIGDYTQLLVDLLVADNTVEQEVIQQDPNSYFGAGLDAEQIVTITKNDYFSYWNQFKSVVVVDYDNYEAGLMASTFASFLNMPIIFIDDTNLAGYENVIEDKNIYVVGDVDSTVMDFINSNAILKKEYTKAELEEEYISLTNTDKIMLVNTVDKTNFISDTFTPEKSTVSISELFGLHSLTAPFLAAARQEVILDVADAGVSWSPPNPGCEDNAEITQNVQLVDDFLVQKIQDLFNNNAEYLTIVASPRAIPDSVFNNCDSGLRRQEKDLHYGLDPDDYYHHHNSVHPSIDIDSSGDIHITWTDQDDQIETSEIYYSKLDGQNGNKIIQDTLITTNEDPHPVDSRIRVDSLGNAHIVWRTWESGAPNKIYYAKLDGQNGNKIIPNTLITSGSERHPDIALDSIGNAHIIWNNVLNNKIYYSKVDGTNGDILIQPLLVNINQNVDASEYASVDVDSSGNVHIAALERKSGTPMRTIAHYKLDGSNGNVIFNKTSILSYYLNRLSASIDTNDDFHIVWRTYGYEDKGYYSKFNGVDGTQIIPDTQFHLFLVESTGYLTPSIAVNSNNNAYIAWVDEESETLEIYYSKINGTNGDILINGERISDVGEPSVYPAIATDPYNDINVVWEDQKIDKKHIFYSKIDGADSSPIIEAFSVASGFQPSLNFILKIGRIYGITASDASSYIARSLYYDNIIADIYGEDQFTGMSIASSFDEMNDNAQTIMVETSDSDYDSSCYTCDYYDSNPCESGGCRDGCLCQTGPNYPSEFDEYYKQQFLTYGDHGFNHGWGGTLTSNPLSPSDYVPLLDLSYVFANACSTNNFWSDNDGGAKYVFGATMLRKGCIGYHGTVGVSYNNNHALESIKLLTQSQDISLGELNKILYSMEDVALIFHHDYILLGDPVLKPKFKEVAWE